MKRENNVGTSEDRRTPSMKLGQLLTSDSFKGIIKYMDKKYVSFDDPKKILREAAEKGWKPKSYKYYEKEAREVQNDPDNGYEVTQEELNNYIKIEAEKSSKLSPQKFAEEWGLDDEEGKKGVTETKKARYDFVQSILSEADETEDDAAEYYQKEMAKQPIEPQVVADHIVFDADNFLDEHEEKSSPVSLSSKLSDEEFAELFGTWVHKGPDNKRVGPAKLSEVSKKSIAESMLTNLKNDLSKEDYDHFVSRITKKK